MTTPHAVAVLIPVLVVLSACAAGHVAPAGAGPVPDAVQMALMRQAIAETPLVRMNGEFGTLRAIRPRLDSSGVRLERLGGRQDAMRTAVAGAGQIEPIPWQQISSIQTDRAGSAGKSTMIGGGIGLLVGLVAVLSTVEIYPFAPDQTDEGNGVLAVSTGAGLALGFLIGQHGRRRTVYPPASNDGQ